MHEEDDNNDDDRIAVDSGATASFGRLTTPGTDQQPSHIPNTMISATGDQKEGHRQGQL